MIPQLRLICESLDPIADVYWFTHAGGGTSALMQRLRAADLAFPLRVYSPWMPLREKLVRHSFAGDLSNLAALLADQILADRPTSPLPIVLVGHSFGGALARQIACDLWRNGLRAHRLVLLATPSPQSESTHRELHTLSDGELIAEVDQLFGGVPDEILQNHDLQKLFTPALRYDLKLLETHHAVLEPIDVPLTAVYGTVDRQVGLPQMRGWRDATSSQFRLRSMPGDHFFPHRRISEIVKLGVWDALPG